MTAMLFTERSRVSSAGCNPTTVRDPGCPSSAGRSIGSSSRSASRCGFVSTIRRRIWRGSERPRRYESIMLASTETYAASRWRALMAWLRDELRPTPGRGAAVARIALNCVITVVVAMIFQIPLPAYMAYIVFLVSREERVSTLMTAVAGAVAATLAIALSLLFFTIDASEPALRLALMAVG